MVRRVFLSVAAVFYLATSSAFGLDIIGRVIDADGSPLADASVWVSQERRVQRVRTTAGGAYRLNDLRVGTIELTALKEGYALDGRTAFAVGDTSIDLTLGHAATASLRVMDRRTRPVPGARVKTLAVSGRFLAPVEVLAEHGFPALRSDDEGIITIPFVPADGFVVAVVQHTDYIETPPVYLPVREKPTDTLLRDGLRFRGRTLYDGNPAPDTRVSVFQDTPEGQRKISETMSDRDGLFRFVLPSGKYFVALRHPDYASPKPEEVELRDDNADKVRFYSLLTPCIISGRVLTPEGLGCGGVHVAYREGNVVYEDMYTDVGRQLHSQGAWRHARLPPD